MYTQKLVVINADIALLITRDQLGIQTVDEYQKLEKFTFNLFQNANKSNFLDRKWITTPSNGRTSNVSQHLPLCQTLFDQTVFLWNEVESETK